MYVMRVSLVKLFLCQQLKKKLFIQLFLSILLFQKSEVHSTVNLNGDADEDCCSQYSSSSSMSFDVIPLEEAYNTL